MSRATMPVCVVIPVLDLAPHGLARGMGDRVDQPLGRRYLLHGMIGRGTIGQVYRASVRASGEPVAVKLLRPELVAHPDAVARFFPERVTLTSVSGSHLVQVRDVVVDGENVAIVMDLVSGSDLRSHLQAAGGSLPPAEAVSLAGEMLAGMAALHAAGIVHRDIKPENALLDTAGGGQLLKLTDFGLGKLVRDTVIGTPEYMAPETVETGDASPASDVYSAGIVLYELLSGHTPFAGGHPLAVLRRQVGQPPSPIPGAPGWLWALTAAMLAKDPADRPGPANALAQQLRERQPELAGLPALSPTGVTSPTPGKSPPRAAGTPARRRGWRRANGQGHR